MARKQKTIHYLYKTTCLVTGRYYIGMHSTYNLDDGYMGSGKRLRYSIRKYGVDNHKKEILKFFHTRELLIEAEKEAITPEMITDDNCMNLKGGGEGGFISEEQQRYRSECGNKAFIEKLKTDEVFTKKWKKNISETHKKRCEQGKIPIMTCAGWNKGLELDDKHKENIGKANSIKQKGILNSQYNTMWINNGEINKKINKEELDYFINLGWNIGKKLIVSEKIVKEMISFYNEGNSYQKVSIKFNIPKTTVRGLFKICVE